MSTANCRNLKQIAFTRAEAEVATARSNLFDTQIVIYRLIGE